MDFRLPKMPTKDPTNGTRKRLAFMTSGRIKFSANGRFFWA